MQSLVQHAGAAGKMHPDEVEQSVLKKPEPGTAAIMASAASGDAGFPCWDPPPVSPQGELSKVTERFSQQIRILHRIACAAGGEVQAALQVAGWAAAGVRSRWCCLGKPPG